MNDLNHLPFGANPVVTPSAVTSQDQPQPKPVAPEPDRSRFSMTIDDVRKAVYEAGFPVSKRTVHRWCQRGKLDAIRFDNDTGELTTNSKFFTYMIDPQSVTKRIEQIREREEFKTPQSHDETSQNEPRLATTSHQQKQQASSTPPDQDVTPDVDAEVTKLKEENKELEKEKRRLETDLAVAVGVREHAQDMLDQAIERNEGYREKIGTLNNQLTALEAPIEPPRETIHHNARVVEEGSGDNENITPS